MENKKIMITIIVFSMLFLTNPIFGTNLNDVLNELSNENSIMTSNLDIGVNNIFIHNISNASNFYNITFEIDSIRYGNFDIELGLYKNNDLEIYSKSQKNIYLGVQNVSFIIDKKFIDQQDYLPFILFENDIEDILLTELPFIYFKNINEHININTKININQDNTLFTLYNLDYLFNKSHNYSIIVNNINIIDGITQDNKIAFDISNELLLQESNKVNYLIISSNSSKKYIKLEEIFSNSNNDINSIKYINYSDISKNGLVEELILYFNIDSNKDLEEEIIININNKLIKKEIILTNGENLLNISINYETLLKVIENNNKVTLNSISLKNQNNQDLNQYITFYSNEMIYNPKLPELMINNITFSNYTQNVNVSVINSGNSTGIDFEIRIYYFNNMTLIKSYQELYLKPYDTRNYTLYNITNISNIFIILDYYNNVLELNEENNVIFYSDFLNREIETIEEDKKDEDIKINTNDTNNTISTSSGGSNSKKKTNKKIINYSLDNVEQKKQNKLETIPSTTKNQNLINLNINQTKEVNLENMTFNFTFLDKKNNFALISINNISKIIKKEETLSGIEVNNFLYNITLHNLNNESLNLSITPVKKENKLQSKQIHKNISQTLFNKPTIFEPNDLEKQIMYKVEEKKKFLPFPFIISLFTGLMILL